jgi:hypothetical protein
MLVLDGPIDPEQGVDPWDTETESGPVRERPIVAVELVNVSVVVVEMFVCSGRTSPLTFVSDKLTLVSVPAVG